MITESPNNMGSSIMMKSMNSEGVNESPSKIRLASNLREKRQERVISSLQKQTNETWA